MPTKRYQATLYHDIDDDAAVIKHMGKAQYPQHFLRLLVSLGAMDSTPWPAAEPVTRRRAPCTRVLIRLYDSEAIAAIDKHGLGTLRLLLRRGIRLLIAGKVAPAVQPAINNRPAVSVETARVSTAPASSRIGTNGPVGRPGAAQGTTQRQPAASQLKGMFG